jgi:hypothetical protein
MVVIHPILLYLPSSTVRHGWVYSHLMDTYGRYGHVSIDNFIYQSPWHKLSGAVTGEGLREFEGIDARDPSEPVHEDVDSIPELSELLCQPLSSQSDITPSWSLSAALMP